MKNLIPFALFEAIKPEHKLTLIKRTLMKMFATKYSTKPTSQHGSDGFHKFTAQIGDVVNSYLKTQNHEEIYKYPITRLKDEVFTEIDKLVVDKLKRNDQFKKLFLDK